MQSREYNRATSELASSVDVSGRATAEEMSRGLRTVRERSLGHIAGLTVLGSLMAAGLFVASTPMPAWADENERRTPKGIEALEAKVASLEQTVSALQSQVNTLQSQLAGVQSNHALALGPFVSIDPNPEIGVIGPNIVFSGANIHIVSGSGRTDDNGNPTGLGNLIIGYDEDPNLPLTGDFSDGLPIMQGPGGPSPLRLGDRGGSHNLVIGSGNRFTQAAFSGLVVGQRNTIESFGASVSGGFNNTASGLFAIVTGGVENIASGEFASVSAGGRNSAGGPGASVSGGFENSASGGFASVTAGLENTAGPNLFTSVSGGFSNTASGEFASVSGGVTNTAGGGGTVVIGGQNVTDNKNNSIAPQPPFP